jgi:hypothetical protein
VNGTVVVIHSSLSVLELAEQALRDAGHRVLVSRDAAEVGALTAVVRIDLVVAPASALGELRSRPDPPRTLEIVDGERRSEERRALRAPFTLEQLRDAVALALRATGA